MTAHEGTYAAATSTAPHCNSLGTAAGHGATTVGGAAFAAAPRVFGRMAEVDTGRRCPDCWRTAERYVNLGLDLKSRYFAVDLRELSTPHRARPVGSGQN